MTIIKYTPEQGEILDYIPENDGILMVSAGAGTGKSFMAEQIARLLKPKKGLYTAFNKAIVTEGTSRFSGVNMECKTLHALAYKFVRPGKIEDLTYSCITEKITYSKKALIIKAIDMFFVSDSTDMYSFLKRYFSKEKGVKKLVETATKYIDLMAEGGISPTFNYLLKCFHLMLVEKSVKCQYDLVILDEINDTTAVSLEIFKLIDSPKKLGLGETNQAIYQFLNLVDGFEELKDEKLLNLTQSFRCSTRIAKKIQTFMQDEVSDDFRFVGTDEPVMNGKYLYCTLTNALIIDEICTRLSVGKGFKLLRSAADIFACPLALMSASNGKEPYQKKYKFLMDEYSYYQEQPAGSGSFFQYLLEHVDDNEIQNAVKLLLSFQRRKINLFDIYKRAKSAKVDPNFTIATVFTSKGLEYETVTIANDLNNKIQSIRDNGGIQNEEDLVAYRCYYVAASRCGLNLINANKLPN
ncbi:MAG: AAA family ATPase [Methanococcoides sp.]|nr:AAA family ATPase [Methanococcoides sp.]